MINFLIGKPGQGKTMKAVKLMLEHLRSRDPRPMVSNVRLFAPKVVEYLCANSKLNAEFWYEHIRKTYFFLKEEHLREFYRYRGGLILTSETDKPVVSFGKKRDGGREELFPDFDRVVDGVVYFLDEVHVPFGARNWQTNGPQCLHYLSQHRHFGDDVWCITQHPDQVAKDFRMLAIAYIQMTNRYTQKYLGFTMPPGFVEKHYSDIPRFNSVPYEKNAFPLDPVVGACYDTSAGVGTGGGRVPELKPAKGIPIRILWVAGALVVVILFAALRGGVNAVMGETIKKPPVSAAEFTGGQKPAPALSAGAYIMGVKQHEDGTTEQVQLPAVVLVRLGLNRQLSLVLEDGREIAAVDSGYSVTVAGDSAKVNGLLVPLQRPPRASATLAKF